jgi:hypothetical protein
VAKNFEACSPASPCHKDAACPSLPGMASAWAASTWALAIVHSAVLAED